MDKVLRLKIQHVIVLSIFVMLAFLPGLGGEFLNWDDQSHLTDNAAVQSFDLYRMFRETVQKVYVPLTTLSFAVEHRLFGNTPFVYHLDNLLLHLFNVLLIYFLLQRFGLTARAAFWAALIFGVHPMRVESVAWVTERKDVLYAFFYLLSLHQYWSYLNKKSRASYGGAIVFGILSLLAKPMALSLPLVLALLDWFYRRKMERTAVLDKIPFFLYIVPITWVTYALHVRNPVNSIAEALLTWTWTFNFYIWKFIWPVALVPVYHAPEPVEIVHPVYVFSVLFFIAFVFCVWRFAKNRWWVFAVAFYVLSIFFILRLDSAKDINIVADRFMYLPSLGFCAVLGLGADRVLNFCGSRGKYLTQIALLALWVVIGALSFKSAMQTKIWNDTITLWTYVIRYNPTEFLAYNDRAVGYIGKGFYDLALEDYGAILTFDPGNADVYYNRGLLYEKLKRYSSAIEDFSKVIEQYPYYEKAYDHRGMAYVAMGNQQAALADFERTIAVSPDFPDGYLNRGNIFNHQGLLSRAITDYDRVIVLNPRSERAMNNRGTAYAKLSDDKRALEDFDQAIRLDPKYAEAYYNRSVIYGRTGQNARALADALKAKILGADVPESYLRTLR